MGVGVRAGVGDLERDSLPENRTFFFLEPKDLEAKLSRLALRQDRMSKDDDVTKEGAEFVDMWKNGNGGEESCLSPFPVSGIVEDGGSGAAVADGGSGAAAADIHTPTHTHKRSDLHASALSTTVRLSDCLFLLLSYLSIPLSINPSIYPSSMLSFEPSSMLSFELHQIQDAHVQDAHWSCVANVLLMCC